MLKFFEKYSTHIYFIFRVVAGLLFMQHGAQKLFGLFGGSASPLFSLMGIVGLIEFVGGLAIALGFFTRLAALGSIVVMFGAYFKAHLPSGMIPIANRGELALLYVAIFLVLLANGAKKWSLEQALLKKEIF